jgi:hypothetical protein
METLSDMVNVLNYRALVIGAAPGSVRPGEWHEFSLFPTHERFSRRDFQIRLRG